MSEKNFKKIALIGAFNLEEGYLGATQALRKLGHEVVFVPAMKYKSENPNNHVQLIIDHLNSENPDICLWWRAETLNGLEFHKIRKKVTGKFIMYSWDDPLQWELHKEMPYKCRFLDAAFSCCQDSVEMYKEYGVPVSEWLLPGFDPEVHYPEEDESYKCDVSMVCTNLYDGKKITKHDHFSRKELIDKILEKFPDIDFRIYGSKEFEDIYPKNYFGWVHFTESRKVFYNSKISLCTHIRRDGNKYINERVCQILGSGGSLLVDNVKGIENVLYPQTFMSFNSIEKCLESIEDILNYCKTDLKEMMHPYAGLSKKGYDFAMKKLTWDCWAKTIDSKLGSFNG